MPVQFSHEAVNDDDGRREEREGKVDREGSPPRNSALPFTGKGWRGRLIAMGHAHTRN